MSNKLTAKQFQQAKAEVSGLRKYVVAYMIEIGSRKKQKSKLIAENQDLRSRVNVEKQRNQELASKNLELTEKISEAAVLETEKVKIVTFYSRMDQGKEYEDQTSRASRVNKIRIEFVFYPNQVAEEGERDIWFRILDPDGNLLDAAGDNTPSFRRSEEHTSELQSLMRISYAVFCLKKKINKQQTRRNKHNSTI